MTSGISISPRGVYHPRQPLCMLWALAGCALDLLISFSYSEHAASKSDKYDKMVTLSICWYPCPQAGHVSLGGNCDSRNPEQSERALNYKLDAI